MGTQPRGPPPQYKGPPPLQPHQQHEATGLDPQRQMEPMEQPTVILPAGTIQLSSSSATNTLVKLVQVPATPTADRQEGGQQQQGRMAASVTLPDGSTIQVNY